MSSQTEILAQVRLVLDEQQPAELTIRAIRRLLDRPRRHEMDEDTEHGWPVLRASEVPARYWEMVDRAGPSGLP
ncbi:hypothetical protein [Kribbella ginsengisoli]|uniref:Acyl-CoA carboxylase subunit epsilon n=1 Tax=Kribbella ginsengisoli TaxID=363865 RepID=A0ABP6Y2J6_9ACTN